MKTYIRAEIYTQNIHSNIIHNSQKVETIQMSINQGDFKMQCLFEGLFLAKKKKSTDTFSNMGESWNH